MVASYVGTLRDLSKVREFGKQVLVDTIFQMYAYVHIHRNYEGNICAFLFLGIAGMNSAENTVGVDPV